MTACKYVTNSTNFSATQLRMTSMPCNNIARCHCHLIARFDGTCACLQQDSSWIESEAPCVRHNSSQNRTQKRMGVFGPAFIRQKSDNWKILFWRMSLVSSHSYDDANNISIQSTYHILVISTFYLNFLLYIADVSWDVKLHLCTPQ